MSTVFVCLFWIHIRICPTGSTPEGGPTESSPTTQATRHPLASLLFMSPIPPYLCHASCIRSVYPPPSSCPVHVYILPSIWSAPTLSSCPTHIFNPHKYEPLKPHIYLDPKVLKNYRPVSNLSFLSVLERVVAARLTNYMTINLLHEPMQSANRAACYSTETALVRVQNDILRTLDQVGAAILVLLVLRAAFDRSLHPFYLGWSQFLELKDLLYSGSKRTC